MRWLSILIAVMSVVVLGTATPAAAARNYVNGAGALTDDWGDEPLIGQGNVSNQVALWQMILVADQDLGFADVDCNFGPKTRDATIRWQRRYGLAADGLVGKNTWSKADNYLRPVYEANVQYVGRVGHVYFVRHPSTSSHPYMYEMYVINDKRPVWYYSATFPSC